MARPFSRRSDSSSATPAKPKKQGRISQLWAIFQMTRRADPAVRSFVDYLGAHVVPALAGAPEAPVVAPTARKAAG